MRAFKDAAITKDGAASFGDRYCTGAHLGGNPQGHLEFFPGLLHFLVRGEGAGPNPVSIPFLADESRDLLALDPGQQSPGVFITTEFSCQKTWLLGGFQGGEGRSFLFRGRAGETSGERLGPRWASWHRGKGGLPALGGSQRTGE